MTSEGYWARFSTLPVRSLNCLPQARQRNRRSPWAVRSDRSVTASEPHSKHRIFVRPSVRGGLYTHPSPCWPGIVARALTEPDRALAKSIIEFRFRQRFKTEADAIRELIQRGLEGATETKPVKAQAR